MNTKKHTNWGGVRKGAGRKKSDTINKTAVIRVDENLLPLINILKEKYKAGQAVENLLSVTNNQDENLQAENKELNDLVKFLNQKIYELNDKPLKEKNNDLEIKLEQYKKTGLKLVLERDGEHQRVIKLETRYNALESDKKGLTAQLSALQHKEHDCQALTRNGSRCTKPAKVKTNWHGVEINTCLQHSKLSF